MTNLITYKIVADVNGRLKTAARTSSNFWNRFIEPSSPVVIRLGTFTSFGTVIARAYQPYTEEGVVYGVVEFNTMFLAEYTDVQVAGTVVHEIGHTLGYGWKEWMTLFNQPTGKFKESAIIKLPTLDTMLVETDFGPGTMLSHWDEEMFAGELMTGIKNDAEHVLPVTIDVAALLGHKVIERLEEQTSLEVLLTAAQAVQFTQQQQAKALNLDHYVQTPIWEETYAFGRRKRPPS